MKKRTITLLTVFALLAMLLVSNLPVAAAGDELVLDDCDSTANWVANSQGKDALTLDKENKISGAASVGAHAINGKLNHIIWKVDTPVDLRGYKYLEFDMYFNELTWFNDCGGVMWEITSSGTCDMQSNRWMKGTLRTQFEENFIDGKDGWWHFKLTLDEPQTQANGGCDLGAVNYFRFYSVDPISTTPDYDVRIDNLKATNNEDTPSGGGDATTAPTKAKTTTKATTAATQAASSDPQTPGGDSSDEEPSAPVESEPSGDESSQPDESNDEESNPDSEPETNPTDSGNTGANSGLSTGALIGIIAAAVVVSGGAVFAICWFVLRKKK